MELDKTAECDNIHLYITMNDKTKTSIFTKTAYTCPNCGSYLSSMRDDTEYYYCTEGISKFYRDEISYQQREVWIKDVLSNDEYSTNEELLAYFTSEGVAEKEAQDWISKRSFYMNNIVMDDGSVYKPKL